MKPSVLLVDDHAIVREGMVSLLSLSGLFGAIAEAADGAIAVTLAQLRCPDIVVLDLLMPNTSGVDATRILRASCPHTKIVILTSCEDEVLARAAMGAGAHSFLLKSMSGEEILQALHTIAQGAAVIHPAIAAALLPTRRAGIDLAQPVSLLTPREIVVLLELAQGASNAKIAAALNITERTVKSHIGAILAKLNLADRTEAVAFTWRNGLVKQ